MKSRRLKKLQENEYCWYCGEAAEDVDHKTPVSKGGTNEKENLAAACRRCNNAKGSMTIDEFREFLKARAAKRSTKHTVLMVQPYDFLFYGERQKIKCYRQRPAHYELEDLCRDCLQEMQDVIDEYFDGDPLYPIKAALEVMQNGEPDEVS